jgi:peptide deformylase
MLSHGGAICYEILTNPLMSILKVARLGHPVLRKVAEPVSEKELRSDATGQFITDMVETMREYDGVGLAADQVHVSKQIAVLEVADNPRYPEKPTVPLTVLINPMITPLSEELEEDWEGCLSIPDMRGKVPRYKSIKVQTLDGRGALLEFVATGFHARVIQHEWDHLHGKVYLDRMSDLSTLCFITEFARYWLGK